MKLSFSKIILIKKKKKKKRLMGDKILFYFLYEKKFPSIESSNFLNFFI